MKPITTYTYEIEKSKFLGFVYETNNEDDFKKIYEILKKEHKKARHICYGYIFTKDNQTKIKTFDDGEPKGTASIPILNAIQNSKNTNNISLFIVRYFGGIKLGKGGLYRAYSKCAIETLKQIKMI